MPRMASYVVHTDRRPERGPTSTRLFCPSGLADPRILQRGRSRRSSERAYPHRRETQKMTGCVGQTVIGPASTSAAQCWRCSSASSRSRWDQLGRFRMGDHITIEERDNGRPRCWPCKLRHADARAVAFESSGANASGQFGQARQRSAVLAHCTRDISG